MGILSRGKREGGGNSWSQLTLHIGSVAEKTVHVAKTCTRWRLNLDSYKFVGLHNNRMSWRRNTGQTHLSENKKKIKEGGKCWEIRPAIYQLIILRLSGCRFWPRLWHFASLSATLHFVVHRWFAKPYIVPQAVFRFDCFSFTWLQFCHQLLGLTAWLAHYLQNLSSVLLSAKTRRA